MTKTEKETGAQQKPAGKSWSTPRSEMTEAERMRSAPLNGNRAFSLIK